LARKLRAHGIETPLELAATYPRDYKDWRRPTPLGAIVGAAFARAREPADAESNEEIAVGRIVRVSEFRARVPVVSAEIEDESGRLKATWFGRRGLKLSAGERIFVHGRAAVRRTPGAGSGVVNLSNHKILIEEETEPGAVVPG